MRRRVLDALMPIDGKMPGSWTDVCNLQMICNRYGGRLHELKADGYSWEKRWSQEDNRFYYRLTKAPCENAASTAAVPATAPALASTTTPEHPICSKSAYCEHCECDYDEAVQPIKRRRRRQNNQLELGMQ
jgi:hypothetical protein